MDGFWQGLPADNTAFVPLQDAWAEYLSSLPPEELNGMGELVLESDLEAGFPQL